MKALVLAGLNQVVSLRAKIEIVSRPLADLCYQPEL